MSDITYIGQGNLGKPVREKSKQSTNEPGIIIVPVRPILSTVGKGVSIVVTPKSKARGGVVQRNFNKQSGSIFVGRVGFGVGQIVSVGSGPYLMNLKNHVDVATAQFTMNYLYLLLVILLLISAFIWALLRFFWHDFISPARLSNRKNKTNFSIEENIPLQNGYRKKSITSDSVLSNSASTKNYSNMIFNHSTIMPQSNTLLVECVQLKIIFTVSTDGNSPSVWSTEDGTQLDNKLEKSAFQGCRSVLLAQHGRVLVGLMNADHIAPNMCVPKFWHIFTGQLIPTPNFPCQSACIFQSQYLVTITNIDQLNHEISIYDITNLTTLQKLMMPEHPQVTKEWKLHNTTIYCMEDEVWILLSHRHSVSQTTKTILYMLALDIVGNKRKPVVKHRFQEVYYGPPGFFFINDVRRKQGVVNNDKKIKKSKQQEETKIGDPVLIAYPSGKTVELNQPIESQEQNPLVNQKIISIQPNQTNENLLILQPTKISIFQTQPQYKLEFDLPITFDFEICTMTYSPNQKLVGIFFDSGRVIIYRFLANEHYMIGTYELPCPIVKLQFLQSNDVLIALSSKASSYRLFLLPYHF